MTIEDDISEAELDALPAQWAQKELEEARRREQAPPEVSEEEWQSLMNEKQTGEDNEK